LNRVFVATAQGIDVYRADDGQRLAGESFGGTFAFRDIAIDPQGNLYALRESPTGTVRVHFWAAGNFSGTGTELFSASGNTDPRALVVDEDGNLYITVNPAGGPFVRKFDRSGNLLATYKTPSGSGTLIGLDYDPGTQRLFASHTGTGIGQILWIDRNASSGSPMTAFGPTNLSGVRWLALYPTPEPSVALLVLAGGAALWWRRRQGGRESVHRKRE
jgi:sugar lactone lactonase YvrE